MGVLFAVLQAATLVLILAVLYRPLGDWMARIYTSDRDWRIERGLYRLVGVDPRSEQSWPAYLRGVLAFSVIACLFAVIYKALPQAPLSWGDVWIGSAFTAALFTLGKAAIGMYLGASGVASAFGAAGSLIALLLWVYYSAQIFFLGAEFTRHYALRFGSLCGLSPATGPTPTVSSRTRRRRAAARARP